MEGVDWVRYDVYDSVKRLIMENVTEQEIRKLGINISGKKKFPVRQKASNGLTYSIYKSNVVEKKQTSTTVSVPTLKTTSGCRFGFTTKKGKFSDIWR